MWNISCGFKFVYDFEDRQIEGKLGNLFRSGWENFFFV